MRVKHHGRGADGLHVVQAAGILHAGDEGGPCPVHHRPGARRGGVGREHDLANREADVRVSDDRAIRPHFDGCRRGFQSSCVQREFMSGAQAPRARVPLADGTLLATPELPPDDLIPSLLAVSDVLGTGWYAADAARVQEGSTVAVVGDGAVGLMGVLAAKQMGAARIIAMSRHKTRQDLALEFGATDIITERGDEGVSQVKALTEGVGADSVLECVGTMESMTQAIQCARPGAMIGYVGVPHGVHLDGQKLFFSQTGMLGGPAPVRRFLPDLIDRVLAREINPGKVFDLTLPLADVAEGYRAMDERRAIKTMLRV